MKKIVTMLTALIMMSSAAAAVTPSAETYMPQTSSAVSVLGAAPATVTMKSAYSSTMNAIRINWNKVSGATGYRVYRYNGSTKKWDTVATIKNGSTVTYRDSKSLTPKTSYQYKVKAYTKVNGVNQWGSASKAFTASTKAVPTVKMKSSYSSTTNAIRINWDQVSGASGYRVYRYNSSTKTWDSRGTVKSGTTLTFRDSSSLSAGTAYKYKVKAYVKVNGVNYWGDYSNELTAYTKSLVTTPVADNGQLRVSGANIVNRSGKKFQIRGMSTHGIMWEDYSDILSSSSLKTLRDDWGVNTIRIAMYTEEWGGYTTGAAYASQAKAKVNTGVKNATDLGMYVIIDWHILNDGNPQKHQTEAVAFFTEMAKKYKDYNNVMYEICNEPNGNVTWSSNIKPYAEKVISAIRKYDSDAIIIVGTGTWSQDIDKVVNSRLSDKNTVYALHFYANTHTDWLRNRFSSCYSSGLPILVSEFGTCDASGNGGYNAAQTKKWLTLLDSKNVGYINWSAASKNETASAFKPGTNLKAIKSGTSQLTDSGKLIRSWYRDRAGK